jgi:predicted PurR-regulated permease PerM
MDGEPRDLDRLEEARRRIVRRAARYMYGFMAAAVVAAVGGAALIAWLFTGAGMPFVKTWAVLVVVILGIPVLGQVALHWRAKRRGAKRSES